jgi:hypothetical protein
MGAEGWLRAAITRAACVVRAVQHISFRKVLQERGILLGKWEECGTGMPANSVSSARIGATSP